MKKIFYTLVFSILSLSVLAQAPQSFNYQAVLRDDAGEPMASQDVTVKIDILQGSAGGAEVFTETHDTQTNEFGLVNLQIGSIQSLEVVDWSADEYFLQVSVNGNIMGTTQLLSVPYALHAKTAETVTGEGSGSRYVGELFGGGVVFWVDHTGQHGLIVSMVDLSTNHAWSNVTNTLIGTTNDWDGANNTTAIIEQSGHTSSAAQLCANYTNADYGTGTYSDWYLPSVAEVNHIWNNFYEVQKALTIDGNPDTTPLARAWYWSSSEADGGTAMGFSFLYGFTSFSGKGDPSAVRAVRAF